MASSKTAKTNAAPSAATGSHAEYDHFLPEAMALDAGEVVPFRADASLAFINVTKGLASLLAREAEAKLLPGIQVSALKQLPDKCLAVAFAATQVADGSSGVIAPKLTRAAALRRKLFLGADALAEAGLFPAEKVKALHAGSGKIDLASDCVGLAALYKAHAKQVKGKTAVTAAEVDEAATVGSELLKLLKPGTARKTRSEGALRDAEVRDRLWTLVARGYDDLWRACAFLYGPALIEDKVPALLAHAATTSNRKKANAKKKAEAATKGGEKKGDEAVGG